MSKLPAMPLWVDVWRGDTGHLSRIERCLYHDLLVLMWITPACRVPNDMKWIGHKLACREDEIEILKSVIAEFCDSTGNWITQKRLKKEYEFVTARVEKRKKAAEARWAKNEVDVGRKLNAENQSDPDNQLNTNEKDISKWKAPTPTPTHTEEEDKKEDSCPIPAAPGPDLFPSEQSQDQTSKPRKPISYPKDFEQFWSAYPTDPGMSKKKAADQWRKLDPDDRAKAITTIPAFRKWVARQGADYRVVHAQRFLSDRRFDGFVIGSDGSAEIRVDWENRLSIARKRSLWDVRNWGPMPGQPGCLAPSGLLMASDGHGWSEFKRT